MNIFNLIILRFIQNILNLPTGTNFLKFQHLKSMWALFAVASAVFLGTYDVFKKLSLNSNAVLPVLFFSTLTSAVIFLPIILVSNFFPGLLNNSIFFIPPAPLRQHAFFFLKSVIVT